MKKFFSSLLAIMLCTILSLSVLACTPTDPSNDEPQPPKPEPIVAVDGVNVQDVIDAFGPISQSEYLPLTLNLAWKVVKKCFMATAIATLIAN